MPRSTLAAPWPGSPPRNSARWCAATTPRLDQQGDPPRITRADLIVVDDIGMLPVGEDATDALYRLVDARYEKRTPAILSNTRIAHSASGSSQ